MAFCDVEKRRDKELGDGVLTKSFWGEHLIVSLVEIEPYSEVPAHRTRMSKLESLWMASLKCGLARRGKYLDVATVL